MAVKHYLATVHILVRLDDSVPGMSTSEAAACDAIAEWLRAADEFLDWGYIGPEGGPNEITIEEPYEEGDFYRLLKGVTQMTTEAYLTRLQNAIPFLQEIENLAYAVSAQAQHLGPRRSAERIGIRAADLVHAITTVLSQET